MLMRKLAERAAPPDAKAEAEKRRTAGQAVKKEEQKDPLPGPKAGTDHASPRILPRRPRSPSRPTEEERRLAEARRADAAKRAEEVRITEEALKAEQAKKAEEAKKADAAAKAEQAKKVCRGQEGR